MLGQGLKYNTSKKPILSSSDILVPLPHDELLKQRRGFCAKHFQPPPSRAGFCQLLLTVAWLWSRGGTLEALPVCRRHGAPLAVPHCEHLPSSQRSGAALLVGNIRRRRTNHLAPCWLGVVPREHEPLAARGNAGFSHGQ